MLIILCCRQWRVFGLPCRRRRFILASVCLLSKVKRKSHACPYATTCHLPMPTLCSFPPLPPFCTYTMPMPSSYFKLIPAMPCTFILPAFLLPRLVLQHEQHVLWHAVVYTMQACNLSVWLYAYVILCLHYVACHRQHLDIKHGGHSAGDGISETFA